MIEMNQLTLTDYQDIKQEIRNNMQNIVVSFVEIGFYLKKIRDEKMYKDDGYNTIWEFAMGEFKLDRTAASRFMHINDKYSIDGNSRYLQDQYQGFSKSTLIEMLSLPVEDYELIKADTKIDDIRELKAAEREQQEEKESQIEGQESLLSIMPDVLPESEKPKKEEVTISDVLRELFKPREEKERLDSLCSMDPNSDEMRWWVNDFNQTGNRTFKKVPFFIFFYSLEEGLKIKNLKEASVKTYTYTDFYFMVRAAFHQETVRGRDVWAQAFGEEYEEELRAQEEAEKEKAMIEAEQKMIAHQREERQRAIKENQQKSAVEESKTEVSEQKEDENAAALKEINENSTSDNEKEVVDNSNVENKTETLEIVTGTVEQEEKTSVCDIAQDEVMLLTTQKCIEKLEHLGLVRENYKDVEVIYDVYCGILRHGERYLISKEEHFVGEKLNVMCGSCPPIKVIVLNYRSVPHKGAGNVYGFEVESYGQEE